MPETSPSLNGGPRDRSLAARASQTPGRPPRVLILTTAIGEGHDLPARVLATELVAERPDTDVEIADGLAAMGRVITAVVKDGYRVALGGLPWLFEFQYWLITRVPAGRWLLRTLAYGLGARGLLRLIAAHDPDIVVSTYPGVTEVLGTLRRRGRLGLPVCSAITDLAGLRYWAHPGVDLHLVTHQESIQEVEHLAGPTQVEWVRGLTSGEFLEPRDTLEARRSFGLPETGKVVAVSGGGWGVGDLESAVRVALAAPVAAVVCLCGRNEELRRRLAGAFADDPRVFVLGFIDRMRDLLAAADAIVHSTAGLTVLEAQMSGCPAISYGWGIGHIRANNEAFVRSGLAAVASSEEELSAALEDAIAEQPGPNPVFAALPSAASLILASTLLPPL